MKITLNYFYLFFIFCSSTIFAQSEDFCFSLTNIIKIENEIDIPEISDNGDGTITLTHPNQAISNIFANYTIYGLEQTSPNTTTELMKYYTVTHGSRDLIVEIQSTISEDIYFIETDYTSEFPFYDSFIDFIDGKEFIYSAIGQSSDEGGNCQNIITCDLNNVSNDTDLSVIFNYEVDNETLFLETMSPSTCGNEFKIGFKPGVNQNDGGSSIGTMQEWSIESVVVGEGNNTDACFWPERFLYDLLGIGCEAGGFYSNISMYYTPEVDKIRFFRENAIFFTGIVEFRDPDLSINESPLDTIIVYQQKGNPFLQVVNNETQDVTIQLLDINGRVVIENQALIDNIINISGLPQALYLIELTDATDNKQVVKFLKQ